MQDVVAPAEGAVGFEERSDGWRRVGGSVGRGGFGGGGEDVVCLRMRGGVAGFGLLLEGAQGAQGGFLLQVEGLQALGGAVAEGRGGDARDVGDCDAGGCGGGEGCERGGEGG